MKYRDLAIGDEFDFVDPDNPAFNSFFDRCVKVSSRKYRSIATGTHFTVGTVKVRVFHVKAADTQRG